MSAPKPDRDAVTGAFPPLPVPRAALVTGAARRIGRALARALAADGYAVAIHHRRSHKEAAALAAEINGRGGRAAALAADLADEDETARLLPEAAAALGGAIGVLVNNASLFENDTLASATRASWEAHLAVNLRAPLLLTQEFARALPADAGGVIVNMLDERVWNLTPYFLSYTLTKSALWTLTRTAALALAPRIRVNGIGPGLTLPSPRQSADQFLDRCQTMPLKRGTGPEEIAAALRFILAAPAMTGQMIALDGGEHLGWAPSRGMPVLE